MSATDIQLSIVNQALTMCGEDAVLALTGNFYLGTVAITNYEPVVKLELETGAYLFAVKTFTPALLTARASDPLPYQYELPAEATKLLTVLYANEPLNGADYAIEGRKVRARYDTNISFRIAWRPDEELWPERFCNIVVMRLKAIFQSALEKHDDAHDTDKRADVKTVIARHSESFQSRNVPQQPGSIIDRRRGLIGRR
jgi:hypothetical protein